MTAPGPLVIIADDDRALRAVLAGALRRDGYQVILARDGEELVQRASEGPWPAIVVTDFDMPRMNGTDAVRRLRDLGMVSPCLVVTAFGDPEVYAIVSGLADCQVLDKPVDLVQLRARVLAAIR